MSSSRCTRSLSRFRQDPQFTSWIYRIAMNACIDHRRRQLSARRCAIRRPLQRGRRAADGEYSGRRTGPGDHRLCRRARDPCSRQRSAGCRTASGSSSSCVTTKGLKLGEIASALGLAEGTVKRQLHAAVHRLRAVLNAANVTVGGRPVTGMNPPESPESMMPCEIQASGAIELVVLRRARSRRAPRDRIPSCRVRGVPWRARRAQDHPLGACNASGHHGSAR